MNSIFSPGKLMLTAEYFALDGALVLAVPTKPGQELFYADKPDQKSIIYWEAFHQNQPWLNIKIDYKNWMVLETNLPDAAAFIMKVLKNIQHLSSTKLQNQESYHLKTNLQFPSNYGLGSSSTLMNNLSEWANINPFELNQRSLGGSGYDIAVAASKSAILFQSQPEMVYHKINFNPDFKDQLIFIHLNQKQDSREGIRAYRAREKSIELIREITEITNKVVQCSSLSEFESLMNQHEDLVSGFLGIEKAKNLYFKDCPSFIKSLGAWGGDFVMSKKFEDYQNWFSERGFETIFEYKELIH